MREKVRSALLLLLIAIVFCGGMLMLSGESVKAADSTWINEYQYRLYKNVNASIYGEGGYFDAYDNIIILFKYNGNKPDVTIPGSAEIGGVKYTTIIQGNSDDIFTGAKGEPFFEHPETLKTLKFDGCVITKEDNILYGCVNLKSIDFSGLKPHVYLGNSNYNLPNISFCTELEMVDFHGIVLNYLSDSLIGCKKLTTLITPSSVNGGSISPERDIKLPVAMFEEKGGVLLSKPYIYLNKAPANSVLKSKNCEVAKKNSVIKYEGLKYKVTSSIRKEVELLGPVKKAPSSIFIDDVICDSNGVVYNVKSIANDAFKNNKTLKELTIYAHGLVIKKCAFKNCSKLKNVSIYDRKVKIKNQAFMGSAIEFLRIETDDFSIKSYYDVDVKIGNEAFKDCSKLSDISFGDLADMNYNKCIGKNSFKGIKKKAIVSLGTHSSNDRIIKTEGQFRKFSKKLCKVINKKGGAKYCKV